MIDENSRNHDDNEVEFFSWQQYRKERRQSEKVEERKRRKTRRQSNRNSEIQKIPSTIDVLCSALLDESDRTATTVATTMTDHDSSVSTLLSLTEVDIKDTSAAKSHGDVVDKKKDIIQQQQKPLADNVLDHVVLATSSDIDSAVFEFYKLTGVKPIKTGYFNGMGISKARVAFATWEDDGSTSCSSFLEIIAPDPDRDGPIGALLKESGTSSLVPFHWAIRNSKAEALVPKATKTGYTPDFLSMKGPDQDGNIKKWETLFLYSGNDNSNGICPPFFINWDAYDHPCKSLPVVGELNSVRVRYPSNDKTHQLLAHTGSTGFTLEEGKPHFEVQFESPKGPIRFATDAMTGFKIPGFDDINKSKTKNEEKQEEVQEVAPVEDASSTRTTSTDNGKSKQPAQEKPKQVRESLPEDDTKMDLPTPSKEGVQHATKTPVKRASSSGKPGTDTGKPKQRTHLPATPVPESSKPGPESSREDDPKQDIPTSSTQEAPPATTVMTSAKKQEGEQTPKTTKLDLKNAVSGMAAKSMTKKPKDNNSNINQRISSGRPQQNKENQSFNTKTTSVADRKAQRQQRPSVNKVPRAEENKNAKEANTRSATAVPSRTPEDVPSSTTLLPPTIDRPSLSRTAGNGKRASLVVVSSSLSSLDEQAVSHSNQEFRPSLERASARTGKRGSLLAGKGGLLATLETPNASSSEQRQQQRNSLVELPTTVFISECCTPGEPTELWKESILMYPVQ